MNHRTIKQAITVYVSHKGGRVSLLYDSGRVYAVWYSLDTNVGFRASMAKVSYWFSNRLCVYRGKKNPGVFCYFEPNEENVKKFERMIDKKPSTVPFVELP